LYRAQVANGDHLAGRLIDVDVVELDKLFALRHSAPFVTFELLWNLVFDIGLP